MSKTVLTIGTFDHPHKGHVKLLQACKKIGDWVVVGVNTDEFVKKFKGKKPIMSLDERMTVIGELKSVDDVISNEEAGRELILKFQPDFLVIGTDWANKDYYKQINMTEDELEDYSIQLIYVPYTKDVSTSDIKRRINEN